MPYKEGYNTEKNLKVNRFDNFLKNHSKTLYI